MTPFPAAMAPELRFGFECLPERVRQQLRPSLRLQTTRTSADQLTLGQSRIGGVPDLPKGFEWPRFKGKPLTFVAQLELSLVATFPSPVPLPGSGTLVFFYASEDQPWGFDPKDAGGSVVAYIPASQSLTRTDPSEDLPELADFACCTVRFVEEATFAPPGSVHYIPELTANECRRLNLFLEACRSIHDGPLHRLGGHADVIQNPMELECQLVSKGVYCGDSEGFMSSKARTLSAGATDWRLLLQIDTDDEAQMMWGDGGRLFFWIRDQDLLAQRFEDGWLILQCS